MSAPLDRLIRAKVVDGKLVSLGEVVDKGRVKQISRIDMKDTGDRYAIEYFGIPEDVERFNEGLRLLGFTIDSMLKNGMNATIYVTKPLPVQYCEYYILDDDNNPVPAASIEAWSAWFEEASKSGRKVLRRTKVLDDCLVSTVFLGIDHGFGDGPPILFETMIFGGDFDGEQRRYSTATEALAFHDSLVALAKEKRSS